MKSTVTCSSFHCSITASGYQLCNDCKEVSIQSCNKSLGARVSMFEKPCRKVGRDCLTWSELFDPPIAHTGINRQEVFEPGDLRVGVTACSAEHVGCASAFHHLQLGTHVNVGEAWRKQVLCGREKGEDGIADFEIINMGNEKSTVYLGFRIAPHFLLNFYPPVSSPSHISYKTGWGQANTCFLNCIFSACISCCIIGQCNTFRRNCSLPSSKYMSSQSHPWLASATLIDEYPFHPASMPNFAFLPPGSVTMENCNTFNANIMRHRGRGIILIRPH